MILLACWSWLFGLPGLDAGPQAKPGFSVALDQHARAVEAYRASDWKSAQTLWLAALEASQDGQQLDRAALCYNLGNAAYRLEDRYSAVAWYSAALKLEPRFSAARANLELARREAGLEPADRGDLEAALHAALSSLTRAESEWLALGALLLVAVAFLYEALRGGPRGRRWVGASLVLLAIGLLPWMYGLARAEREPWMVTSATGAELFAEPRSDSSVTGELEVATPVEQVDAWADWIKVQAHDGKQGWILRDQAQTLSP